MQLQNNYTKLLQQITAPLKSGQVAVFKFGRRQMLLTYWAIGQHIVEFEQKGQEKSVYGSKLLNRLSKDLSHQLTWGHIIELLKIDHDLERSFYEKQTIHEKWNVRELKNLCFLSIAPKLLFTQFLRAKGNLKTKSKILQNYSYQLYELYFCKILKMLFTHFL